MPTLHRNITNEKSNNIQTSLVDVRSSTIRVLSETSDKLPEINKRVYVPSPTYKCTAAASER